MKKLILVLVALFLLLFISFDNPDDSNIIAQTKDTILPNWRWTSGEVGIHKTAAKQCFTIVFTASVFHPRDSILIKFTSYKVAITTNNKGAVFGSWKGKSSLVYYINANWIPMVDDTNDRINQPFSGRNNITSDSLKNYTVRFAVPLSRTLTISSSTLSISIKMADGHDYPVPVKDAPTLTTSIRGIEVRKLE